MLNSLLDKNKDTYRGGEGTTPVITACPDEDRSGLNLLLIRVKLESESDDEKHICIQRVVRDGRNM